MVMHLQEGARDNLDAAHRPFSKPKKSSGAADIDLCCAQSSPQAGSWMKQRQMMSSDDHHEVTEMQLGQLRHAKKKSRNLMSIHQVMGMLLKIERPH